MAIHETLDDSPTKQPTTTGIIKSIRFFSSAATGKKPRSNKRTRRNFEEEEYLAMCLVKLATGSTDIIKRPASLSIKYPKMFKEEEEKIIKKVEEEEEEKSSVLTTTTTIVKKEDEELKGNHHTCNDCNRSFSTHQGLGGHKASHRSNPTKTNKVKSSTGGKVHECNICQKTFPSGQALGGHMRKHFKGLILSTKNRSTTETVKSPVNETVISTGRRVVLDIDLNVTLTPPEEADLYCGEVLSAF